MRGKLPRAMFEKQMTRKEFLQIVGSSTVVLLGIPNFLNMLQGKRPKASAKTAAKANYGFGANRFGV